MHIIDMRVTRQIIRHGVKNMLPMPKFEFGMRFLMHCQNNVLGEIFLFHLRVKFVTPSPSNDSSPIAIA